MEVVGVAKDGKYRYISDVDHNFIYVPMAQQPASRDQLLHQTRGRRPIAQEVRAAFAQVEPNVPILMMQSFDDATAIGLLPQRLAAWIAGSVGVVGVFLAALGLYGLMAFLVAQRTREIAIRMALGASDGDMQSMVLKQAARLSAIGGVVGLALAGAICMLFKTCWSASRRWIRCRSAERRCSFQSCWPSPAGRRLDAPRRRIPAVALRAE